MRRLPFVAIVLASLGGLCSPRFNPPQPDACDHPADVALDGVEIGTGDDASFIPLHDGDVVQPIRGGQGGTMIPIRLRLTGAATPPCLTQSTSLAVQLTLLASDHSALKTYPQPDGSRLTKPDYLIFSSFASAGDPIDITVVAGMKTSTRRVYYQMTGDGG